MNRRHLMIPAALLAASAVLGGTALLHGLPLGTDPAGSSSGQAAATLDPASPTDAQIAQRQAALDATAARLKAIAAQRPPALPAPVSAVSSIPVATGAGSTYTPSGSSSSGSAGGGSGQASGPATSTAQQHDGYEAEYAEHRGDDAEYEHQSGGDHQEHEHDDD